MLDAAPAFNCVYRYDLVPGLQLHISIRTIEVTADSGSPCLVLEFKALGRPDGVTKLDADAWYERAHDMIVAQFLDMTSEEIQRRYWMPEEETE